MIHRFVDLFPVEELEPNVIYNTARVVGGTVREFTLAGNAAPVVHLAQSQENPNSFNITRPELSPDGTEYVYIRSDASAPTTDPATIRRAPSDDLSADVSLVTLPALVATEIIGWSPDGQQVYYRTANDSTNQHSEVRVMDRDGSNNTLLWSSTTILDTEWGVLPRISPDGTKIALWVDQSADAGVWVMDSDGTNMTHIYVYPNGASLSGTFPNDLYGWSRDSAWLVFMVTNLSVTPRWQRIYKCRPDGTDLTVLYDRQISGTPIEDEVLMSFGQNSVWLPDSSGIVVRYELTTGAPTNHEINVLSSDGSETFTALSPQRLAVDIGSTFNSNAGPVMHGERVWWLEGGTVPASHKVVSAFPDGSDYRVDHDMDTDPVEDDYEFFGFHIRS